MFPLGRYNDEVALESRRHSRTVGVQGMPRYLQTQYCFEGRFWLDGLLGDFFTVSELDDLEVEILDFTGSCSFFTPTEDQIDHGFQELFGPVALGGYTDPDLVDVRHDGLSKYIIEAEGEIAVLP